MRESITLEKIRCERCVSRLAEALAPLSGINDARVELGTSSVIVDYDEAQAAELDAALGKAGFTIMSRRPAEA
jgi:copper chaperone CopZ